MMCVTLVVMMCWSLLCGQAMHLARPRPGPLDSAETWSNMQDMVKKAQRDDRDHETRLIPVISEDMIKEEDTCCIIAMILDYYLNNILHTGNERYPRIRSVRSDLQRVAHDLEPHCPVIDFANHGHVEKFTGNYEKAKELYGDVSKVRNKAVGETDILLNYLYKSCSPRKY